MVKHETVYGVGDRMRTAVVIQHDNYKGTALIQLERVVGHGDKDKIVTVLT